MDTISLEELGQAAEGVSTAVNATRPTDVIVLGPLPQPPGAVQVVPADDILRYTSAGWAVVAMYHANLGSSVQARRTSPYEEPRAEGSVGTWVTCFVVAQTGDHTLRDMKDAFEQAQVSAQTEAWRALQEKEEKQALAGRLEASEAECKRLGERAEAKAVELVSAREQAHRYERALGRLRSQLSEQQWKQLLGDEDPRKP